MARENFEHLDARITHRRACETTACCRPRRSTRPNAILKRGIRSGLLAAGWLAAQQMAAPSASAAVSDHYKCYASRQTFPVFQRRNVTLTDRFESTVETVKRPFRFCNPVDKNDEGIQDATAHLNCYRTRRAPGTPPLAPRIITAQNQFGTQSLLVGRPAGLCLPAEKDGVSSSLDVNHFKCYNAQIEPGQPRFLRRFVSLEDQFESKQTVVKRPRLFCNPVDKNGEGIKDASQSLTCYGISQERGQPRFTRRTVQVEDQFSPGGQPVSVRVSRGILLCVPTMAMLPTPTPSPAPTPSPTPPYGSAARAFLHQSSGLLD